MSWLSFTYDAVGRLTRVSDAAPGAGSMDFYYDLLDRLILEVTPQGAVAYTYDALGRRTTMTVAGQMPVTYQYDADSRLTQVAQGSLVVGLAYDAAGRRTSLTYPNGVTTTYTYDNANRVTRILHQGPAGVIEDLQYTYDAAGNRTSLSRANGTASLLPAAITSTTYDAANEQTRFGTATLTYDANGNLTNDGTNTYTWDARNRLVGISGGVTAGFQYDALGRRLSKTINGVTTSFLYDGNDIAQEMSGGAVTAAYLRSLTIDEPLARQEASGETYYHAGELGSAQALTDQAGAVQADYTYEPFGRTMITGNSSNPFQFTGRENDRTGLYAYRARYYSPTLNRFISEDPIVTPMTLFNACSFRSRVPIRTVWVVPTMLRSPIPIVDPTKITSPYVYVGNNPLRFADPMGLDKIQKECDYSKVFDCETSTLASSVRTCGYYGSALCIAAIRSGGAAAVPTCSLVVGFCVGVYVFSEIYCLEEAGCL